MLPPTGSGENRLDITLLHAIIHFDAGKSFDLPYLVHQRCQPRTDDICKTMLGIM